MTTSNANERPTVAVTLGDPCGIGAELVAGLVDDATLSERADVVVIGDPWLLARGAQCAGRRADLERIEQLDDRGPRGAAPRLLATNTVRPDQVEPGRASAAGGQSSLDTLRTALDLAGEGCVDAVVFAPLNKHALHLSGYGFADELHWFVHVLGHRGVFGELNVLEELWTSRVTSHVALKDVAAMVTTSGIVDAVRLADQSLRRAGFEQPRIMVAALNPHAGDGGLFGREEIDVIEPAVAQARREGLRVSGPFPADTLFLKARAGDCDAVVTMYHDQGQIAMKLLGFDRGVTVHGGLEIPITTPAHGTAYDIVGSGCARLGAIRAAFDLAVRMGASRRIARGRAAPA